MEDLDFRNFFESILDPVIITDGELIVFANQSAHRSLAQPSGGLLAGTNINDVLFSLEEPVYMERGPDSNEVLRVKDVRNVVYEARQSVTNFQNEAGMVFILRRISVLERMLAKFPETNPNAVAGIRLANDKSDGMQIFLNNEAKQVFSDFEETQLPDILRTIAHIKINHNKPVISRITAKEGNNCRDFQRCVVYDPQENFVFIYYNDVTEMCKMASFPERNPNPIVKIDLEDNPDETKFRIDYCNIEAMRHFPELGLAGRLKSQFPLSNNQLGFSQIFQRAAEHEIFSDLDQIIEYLIKEKGRKTHLREVTVRGSTNEEIHYEQKFIYDAAGNSITMFFNDITALKRIEKEKEGLNEQLKVALAEVNEKAIRDPLTQIYNRRFLDESLKGHVSMAARHSEPLGVLMIDIDKFKRFNTNFGHSAGDEVLKKVARILNDCVRKEDIVCRYGGEEFTLILPMTNLEGTMSVAEKLRLAVMEQSQIEYNGTLLPRVTISLGGISVVPLDNSDPSYFLNMADGALSQSKASGRNQTTITEISRILSFNKSDLKKLRKPNFAEASSPESSNADSNAELSSPDSVLSKSRRLESVMPPDCKKTESKRLGSVFPSQHRGYQQIAGSEADKKDKNI
jgi:diguanylate cyclase (GGDEF)-like protein